MTKTKDTNYINSFMKTFKNLKAILFFKMWYDKDLLLFIKNNNIDGIILSGSQYRVLKTKQATIPKKILTLNIPILGICYGYQWLIKTLCGKDCLSTFKKKNKRKHQIKINEPFRIIKSYYKFNHFDYITKVPNTWKILIKKKEQIWMAYNKEKKIIGIQFHPESSNIGKIFYKKWLNFL